MAIQASVQVSRDISVNTVNELLLKSQIDDNIICADERFRSRFENSIHARPSAFFYKKDPSDFFSYSFIVVEESISDCSSLIVYQSSFALVPEQFSDAKKRVQNVGIISDMTSKQYPLLLSKAEKDSVSKDKIKAFISQLDIAEASATVTMRKILL